MHKFLLAVLAAWPLASLAQQSAIDLPDISPTHDAQIADAPVPQVGAWQTFKGPVGTVNCARWEVTATNEDGYLRTACGEYRTKLAVAGSFNLHEITGPGGRTVVRFEPYFPLVQFPIAVGSEWTSTYRGQLSVLDLSWDGTMTCRVTALESVTVIAGTFEAYRIECYDKRRAPMVETGSTLTAWYAPAVPGVVKTVNHEDPVQSNELAQHGTR